MKEDKSKLLEVFTGNLWEAELVKTYLGDNGIRSVTKDSAVVNIVLPSSNIEVSVLVNDWDYEAAVGMVRMYMDNLGKEEKP